jgi:hypothetical protein
MALHKTEKFFANLVKDYLDKTTDKAVKDHVVCNRGGLQMLEPSMKALFDESAAAYKAEQLAAGIPGPVVNDLGCGATFRHNSHEWLSKGPRPPGYAN